MIEENVFEELTPVVDGLGYEIVELRCREIKNAVQLSLVIYRPEGVSLDDCALVHETVQPRVEILLGRRDIRLEVSSPGIERVIKDDREYRIFAGRGIRILERDSQQWFAGTIEDVTDTGFTLHQENAERHVLFADIKKARLDDSQEVR